MNTLLPQAEKQLIAAGAELLMALAGVDTYHAVMNITMLW
jgi:hypothetical protein